MKYCLLSLVKDISLKSFSVTVDADYRFDGS